MRRLHVPVFALLLGATALLSPPARASLILALDTPTMVAEADTIAIVDVTTARAAWDARHERIVTTIELAVVESWKGAAVPAARLLVVQPGGTIDDVTMVVHGMPHFVPGERALVFLRGPNDRAGVVGLAQGKRLVRRETTGTGARFVVAPPDRAGAAFVHGPATRPAFDAAARPLDDLRAEVRSLLARTSAPGGVR